MKMEFSNIKRMTVQSNLVSSNRMKPPPMKGSAISMDVVCQCGHSWHATKGLEKGNITPDVRGLITCPNCEAVDRP